MSVLGGVAWWTWRRLSGTGQLALLMGGAVVTLLFAGAFRLSWAPASNTVTLPIEVIGPDGYTVDVQVNASDVSNVEALYLRAYSIGYPYWYAEPRGYTVDKASVRLNNGPWVDINNATVDCIDSQASLRCVDGPLHTIRFTVPIEALGAPNDGANVISFRFNYAHPSGEMGDPSTGYRILDIEFRTASGANAIDNTTFRWDDPGAWGAPDGFGSAADVRAGEELWHQRSLLIDGWDGENIWASCADCHVDNGYDLAYFAFSNKSIVQRSRFHGLSERQGKQIAAYIRSLKIKTTDGRTIDPPGRPWHPPYQPGPTAAGSRPEGAPRTQGQGFDALDPVHWAAGAGLDWVLDSNDAMKRHVFPNGITPETYPISGDINMRQLPVNIQMPDWNEWLPVHHPVDVWGDQFRNHEVWDHYANDVPDLIYKAKNYNGRLGKAEVAVERLWSGLEVGRDEFKGKDVPAPYDGYAANLSRMQWALTKSFEVMHTNHFEHRAKELYGASAEPLQWFSSSRILFDQAPHIQELTRRSDPNMRNIKGERSGVAWKFFTTAWYQHQLTLNPGSAISTDINPMDWRYHYMFMAGVKNPEPHAWRYIASFLKILYIADKMPEGRMDEEAEGWYHRHTSPSLIDLQHFWPNHSLEGGIGSDAYRRVLNVAMSLYREGMAPEDPNNWARRTGDAGLEPESFDPERIYGGIGNDVTAANHWYTSLRNFGEYGVAYSLLRPMAEWAEEAWPKGDWLDLIRPYRDNPGVDAGNGSPNTAPAVQFAQPTDGATFTAPATIGLEVQANDADGSVASIEVYAGATRIAASGSGSLSDAWSDVGAGTYTLRAVATDDDGETTETSVTITVEAADGSLSGTGVRYAAYTGAWEALPDFGSLAPAQTGTTNNFTLNVQPRDNNFALRYTSYLKVPAQGTYTFTIASDDGSRLAIDGAVVADNDGIHGVKEASGTVELSAGFHAITVAYFEATQGQALAVEWAGPGITQQPIPDARLYLSRPDAVTQSVDLQAGWNLVSLALRPDAPALATLLQGTGVAIVKDEAGRLYSPAYGLEAFTAWDPSESYLLYAAQAATLTVQGTALPTDAPIPLTKGWNLVPYLPASDLPVAEAFASLGDALVVVEDPAGNLYRPGAVNDIGTVRRGRGYKVYVNQGVTLTYPASATTASAN
ncbi:PA14 domain-containing protein [Salisaeta longa]|uniref:PA14 domain-containing protein n=1 Tax=Salisaeta longa TaxID=503170 RepID=UPI0003B74B0D|nr:PA14 domain-containing protein [Salisaeta longa]